MHSLPGTDFLHEQMKAHHFAGMILIALGDWSSSMGELP
jgi:drug/metabolite transporter (DMT)-like permease